MLKKVNEESIIYFCLLLCLPALTVYNTVVLVCSSVCIVNSKAFECILKGYFYADSFEFPLYVSLFLFLESVYNYGFFNIILADLFITTFVLFC